MRLRAMAVAIVVLMAQVAPAVAEDTWDSIRESLFEGRELQDGSALLTLEAPKRAMDAARIRTATAGLYTALPGGASLIEDVTGARMLIVDAGGKLVAEYVNRAEDGEIYHLGWTRYMDRARGDAMLRAVGKAKCNA